MTYEVDANVEAALTLLLARLDAQTHQRDAITNKALGAAALSLALIAALVGPLQAGSRIVFWQRLAVYATLAVFVTMAIFAAVVYWPQTVAAAPQAKAILEQIEVPRATPSLV